MIRKLCEYIDPRNEKCYLCNANGDLISKKSYTYEDALDKIYYDDNVFSVCISDNEGEYFDVVNKYYNIGSSYYGWIEEGILDFDEAVDICENYDDTKDCVVVRIIETDDEGVIDYTTEYIK